jgi:GNAT superfamily N-acetyltransferase
MNDQAGNITGNLHRFYGMTAALCGYEAGKVAGLGYVWNRKGSWPAYILGIPVPGDIKAAVDAIRRGEAPPFWIIDQSAHEEIRQLEESGVRTIRQWKGMVLEKDTFRPAPTDPGIRILANRPDAMKDWMQIINTELMTGTQIGQEFLHSVSVSEHFRWVVAMRDGQTAGTGLSFMDAGICGIYMIATRTSFRGKGVGTQIISDLVAGALDSGCRTVVLHATGMGEGIYRNAGFSEVNRYAIMWHVGL